MAKQKEFSKARPANHSWLDDHYSPTEEDTRTWEEAGFPPHTEIVGSFLMSNNLVFGVPDKKEVFRLDRLRTEASQGFEARDWSVEDRLCLCYPEPSPLPFVYHTIAHPPLGLNMGDVVEVNYNVRLQALIRQMWLAGIRVLHGSETDDSPKIVFEGTECPGPAARRQIRVVRVTVHREVDDFRVATWETVSETTYPRSFF